MGDGIKSNTKIVKATLEWNWPSMQKGLWATLGLVNSYRKFIHNFSKIAKPLSDFLTKGVGQVCNECCYQSFEDLKNKLSSPLVLIFFQFDKPFEVHIDIMDFAFRRVLIQHRRPIALKSKKLYGCQRRWPIHKNEFCVEVHFLKTW